MFCSHLGFCKNGDNTDTTYDCATSSLLAHCRVPSWSQQLGTLQRNKTGFILHFLKGEHCIPSLMQMSINTYIFHEGQLQWDLQQPCYPQDNEDKPGPNPFLTAFVCSCLCHVVSASPPGIHNSCTEAGRGHHRRRLTLLSPFSPPCFYFLTASSLGSHSPHHVCTGQADDCHIESNQEMLLTYLFLLQSLAQTRCSKKPKLFPSNMTTGYKTIQAD